MLKLPKKYLLRTEESARWGSPRAIIAAPKGLPMLDGYVLKTSVYSVYIDSDHITIRSGNMLDTSTGQYTTFMFERDKKIKGHPSKRYRYSEQEVREMYEKAEHVAERTQRSQTGSGSLVRAEYTDFDEVYHCKKKKTDWMIEPDADKVWSYELTYEPIIDIGKHKRSAKGYHVLESYHVDDISLLFHNKEKLQALFDQLDCFREYGGILYDTNYSKLTYTSCRNTYSSKPLSTALMESVYDNLPQAVKSDTLKKQMKETCDTLEKQCQDAVRTYQVKQIEKIVPIIKELTGIEVSRSTELG